MGLGGINIWQLLIILAIVLAIFGTKRFKNIGSDLGGAIKGFRNAMHDGEEKAEKSKLENDSAEDASFENTPGKESSKSGS
ncbi:MAG: Sec-independent protein translocase subunit TatA [Pseudomonadota bacterium]